MDEHNQHDAAIDKTLAALKNATPPEGLEARIAARLQQQPASALPRRHRLIGYTLPTAWWRGAATGAAFTLVAVTAVLLLQHKTPAPNHIARATNAPAPAALPVKGAGTPNTPCASPAVFHPHTPTAPAMETASTSHPIPSSPLTTQERELLRLARTTDPKVLATFNSEHQAQLEAENAAQFERFFTPPPRPPAPPDTPVANPQPDPASPEAGPQATPEAAPSPAPQTSPATND